MTISQAEFIKDMRPLAQELIAYAMTTGKAYGITDVQVSIVLSDELEIGVEEGVVVQNLSGASFGVSIALYAGDRMLSFSQNSSDEAALKAVMLKNMQVIHLAPPNPEGRLLESKYLFKGEVQDLDLFDQNPPDQDVLIDYAKRIEKAAKSVPQVNKTRSTSISKYTGHSLTISTNGRDTLKSGTSYSASIVAIADNGKEMRNGSDYSFSRHFSDMNTPENIGFEAAKKAVAKLGASLPKTGEATIILSPAAAQNFFSSVYTAISGWHLLRKTTFLKDSLNKEVISGGITLVDDPTIKRGFSSGTTDSAGQKMKKITFIKNGILKSFNISLVDARKLGTAPIGRNDGGTNGMVLPGQKTVDELIADIKDGIYIERFSGGTVSVNTGNVSCPASGVLIENGKITQKPVDGFIVSGNLKDMFKQVSIANDTPQLPNSHTSFAVPTTRIDKVMIAGQGN